MYKATFSLSVAGDGLAWEKGASRGSTAAPEGNSPLGREPVSGKDPKGSSQALQQREANQQAGSPADSGGKESEGGQGSPAVWEGGGRWPGGEELQGEERSRHIKGACREAVRQREATEKRGVSCDVEAESRASGGGELCSQKLGPQKSVGPSTGAQLFYCRPTWLFLEMVSAG